MIKKYLKNRIVIITLLLIVFCIFNLFLSYSYYIATVLNNETSATLSLKSSGVTIVYENNSGYLTSNSFDPGSSITKQFSIVSNASQTDIESKIWYNIRLVVEENTFSDNVVACSLDVDSDSSELGQTATEFTNKGIKAGQNIEGMTLGVGYIVAGSNKHVYNLTLTHNVTGTYETDKKINARVIIEVVETVNLNIDLDGGTFPSGASISRVYGKNAILVLETPTKEGFNHIGWEVTSGNASVNGNEITLGIGNISIKALWEKTHSFANDSWETIAYYAQHPVDDRSPYEVGETREISLSSFSNGEANSDGKYTIRVANNSNYDCNLESKTACGFVVEFQDIITYNFFDSTMTNAGGWPVTEMRTYLNNVNDNQSIINALPEDLRAVIADTIVVSGHGSTSGETNFTSTDKLYLLSTREVWGNCTQNSCIDTATGSTRQLDYYANLGVVTTDNNKYELVIKQNNGNNSNWWLRSAVSSYGTNFLLVSSNGSLAIRIATSSEGVAPAFRLG